MSSIQTIGTCRYYWCKEDRIAVYPFYYTTLIRYYHPPEHRPVLQLVQDYLTSWLQSLGVTLEAVRTKTYVGRVMSVWYVR